MTAAFRQSALSDANRSQAMTDRYEKIRQALAMGPTPGPWRADGLEVMAARGQFYGGLILGADDVAVAQMVSAANAPLIAACDPDTIRELLAERDRLAVCLETAREDGARLRETLRDVIGVSICGLFETHREVTLREFSLQELVRVTEVTAPLLEEGVTVESVYRRGYDAAIDQARGKEVAGA